MIDRELRLQKDREKGKIWRLKNIEYNRERLKKWNLDNPEYSKKWRVINHEKCLEYARKKRLKYRAKILNILGMRKCVYCDENDLKLLVFDHKNGDGVIERRKLNHTLAYYANNPEETKEKLQLTCKDCNQLKHMLTHDEFIIILNHRRLKKQNVI